MNEGAAARVPSLDVREPARSLTRVRVSRSSLSVPTAGRTIQGAIARWAHPILDAYQELRAGAGPELVRSVADNYQRTYAPLVSDPNRPDGVEEAFCLACSTVVSVWLLAALSHFPSTPPSFPDAERWFLGRDGEALSTFSGTGWPPSSALHRLDHLELGPDLSEILPYVLEVFDTGPVGASRAADTSRRNNRQAKREDGVFYTPADVVSYIVTALLDRVHGTEPPRCLDPAIGTGIFLRELADALTEFTPPVFESRVERLAGTLYGADISAQAVQSCAFVLLERCLRGIGPRHALSPWRAWQLIRCNLVVADSTRIVRGEAPDSDDSRAASAAGLRERLLDQRQQVVRPAGIEVVQSLVEPGGQLGLSFGSEEMGGMERELLLGELFAGLGSGCDLVAGNPPYSVVRPTGRNGGQKRAYGYLPFVEMLWKLARPERSVGGMVVPLSIAYHAGSDFRRLRCEMARVPGTWSVSFFDRTPDSLFGDDVKTRNAIVLLDAGRGREPSLETTGLLRWNSRRREHLFSSLAYTAVDISPCPGPIPKLGSPLEAEAYLALRRSRAVLSDVWLPSARGAAEDSSVYFAPTAYNWLPVFRRLQDASGKPIGSQVAQGTWEVVCTEPAAADVVFVVAASRLAYWLWRVEGDGFHLNRSFLWKLPISIRGFSDEIRDRLTGLSRELWQSLLCSPVVSVNKGRQTLSFSPLANAGTIDAVDETLVTALSLPSEFPLFLRSFVAATIAAGREEESREA